jgi:hypothetical protein
MEPKKILLQLATLLVVTATVAAVGVSPYGLWRNVLTCLGIGASVVAESISKETLHFLALNAGTGFLLLK